MKLFYAIVFLIAMVIALTAGFKRNNAFFNDRNLGQAAPLTPAAQVEEATEATTADSSAAEKAHNDPAASEHGATEHNAAEGHH
ncbi:MAG: hypothetical protein SFW35_00135 [Chitinophagales bacterium]|nr:hypothetical protein [Chitinophagales bacterium]